MEDFAAGAAAPLFGDSEALGVVNVPSTWKIMAAKQLVSSACQASSDPPAQSATQTDDRVCQEVSTKQQQTKPFFGFFLVVFFVFEKEKQKNHSSPRLCKNSHFFLSLT